RSRARWKTLAVMSNRAVGLIATVVGLVGLLLVADAAVTALRHFSYNSFDCGSVVNAKDPRNLLPPRARVTPRYENAYTHCQTRIGATALVLIVGLAGGFGLGYQIEKSRTKDDLKKARAAATAKEAANNKNVAGKGGTTAGGRLVGKVDSTAGDAFDITLSNK